MTRILAQSRIHFGLLSLPSPTSAPSPGVDGGPGLPVRQFGGVGLMVDRPGLVVRVERAAEWKITGPMAARAEAYAVQRFVETLPPTEHRSYSITVEHAPAEHTGLGVGTQLAMAIAKAIAIESDHSDWPATELAKRVGRGERSAIGIHGFDHGGLVVEGGKLPGEVVSPLVARFDFPAEWSVLLFTPPMETPWHGGAKKTHSRA